MLVFRQRCKLNGQADAGCAEPWLDSLLAARGIDTEEKKARFLSPSVRDLYDPMLLHDMEKAVGLIRAAIRRGDRVLVWGDYDCDGVCAASVLLETLLEEGADASFRLPRRHTEGYGLNENAVREIAREYRLLITVDCGISNVKEVRLARELGMTVIVTDHHELPDELPDADAVIDPLLGDYPFRRLCGAGVALKICQALQGMDGVMKRLDIAALATVADVVPLVDENRVIVYEGLRCMADTARPGLRELIGSARIKQPFRADDLAFRLGPRLNAAGRLEDASMGVELLLTKDAEKAKEIAGHLESNNSRRREEEQRTVAEALELMREQTDLRRDRIIIIEGENWNNGLIGLVAGKLCEKFHHPAIVLNRQGETATGSCRSVEGVNIWKMLSLCSDLFLRFGGHEQAAGLTIPAANIPELRQRLNRVIRENCGDSCLIPVMEYDLPLRLDRVTLDTAEQLQALEPTGCGNPAPVFLLSGADVQEMRRVGDGSHLKLKLLDGITVRDGIAFGMGDEADRACSRVDVLFVPDRNEYNGRVSVQLQVKAIRPAQSADPGDGADMLFPAVLQEMSRLAANRTGYGAEPAALYPEYLLKEQGESLNLTDEQLREVYKLLRAKAEGFSSLQQLAGYAGLTVPQIMTALIAFGETRLIEYSFEPFRIRLLPPVRCSMTDSALIRYLRTCFARP